MDIKEAKLRIKDHMVTHHMAEHPYCSNLTEALQIALNVLGAIDQIKWERDTAIGYLEELGISFGEKINGVYLTREEYDNLIEYKYMYEDLCQ